MIHLSVDMAGSCNLYILLSWRPPPQRGNFIDKGNLFNFLFENTVFFYYRKLSQKCRLRVENVTQIPIYVIISLHRKLWDDLPSSQTAWGHELAPSEENIKARFWSEELMLNWGNIFQEGFTVGFHVRMVPDNRSIISHSYTENSGRRRSKGYSKRLMSEISLTNKGKTLFSAHSVESTPKSHFKNRSQSQIPQGCAVEGLGSFIMNNDIYVI